MRTTVKLSPEVAAAVARLRHERGIGVSEALDELARRGLRERPEARSFVQDVSPLGLRIDVANVARALEELDGPASR